jgi:hypothetical protein
MSCLSAKPLTLSSTFNRRSSSVTHLAAVYNLSSALKAGPTQRLFVLWVGCTVLPPTLLPQLHMSQSYPGASLARLLMWILAHPFQEYFGFY